MLPSLPVAGPPERKRPSILRSKNDLQWMLLEQKEALDEKKFVEMKPVKPTVVHDLIRIDKEKYPIKAMEMGRVSIAEQIRLLETALQGLKKAESGKKRTVSVATQYEEQDTAAMQHNSRTVDLLGLHKIPIRVKRLKSECVLRSGTMSNIPKKKTDEVFISPVLYQIMLDLYDLQHDLAALCHKVKVSIEDFVPSCKCDVFTCLRDGLVNINEGISFPLDSGIVGAVVKERKIEMVEDASKHANYLRSIDEVELSSEEKPVQVLMPLKWASRVIAVMRIVTPVLLTSEMLACVSTLVFHTSSLISLHHPDVGRLEVNTNILKAVGDLSNSMFEDDELVDRIVDSSKMLLNAERCALFHVDNEAQSLVTKIESKRVEMPINSGIAGFVAVSGKGQNIVNAYSDPRFNRNVDKQTGFTTKQILCMPLKCDGKIIAVAQLVNKKDGEPFTEYDECVFETYSTFAAVALRNCKIFEKSNTSNKVNSGLLELARELGCVTLDDSALRASVVKHAKQLVNADRGILFVADWDTSELVGEADGQLIRMAINAGIAGSVVLAGIPMNIPDAYSDPRFNSSVDSSTGYTTTSILATPIKFMGKVIAVAQLINKKCPDTGDITTFTHADEVILNSFGVLAGIAIRTASQYRREMHEKEMFRSMLSIVANMAECDIRDDIAKIGQRLVDDIKTFLKCETVNLYTVGRSKGEMDMEATATTSSMAPHYNNRIVQSVLSGQNIVNLSDAYSSPLFDPAQDKMLGVVTRNILSMSISCRGHVIDGMQDIGIIEVINKVTGDFTERDESTVSFFCSLAAHTIRNAKILLFEKENKLSAMTLVNHAASPVRKVKKTSHGAYEYGRLRSIAIEKNLVKTVEFNVHQVKNETPIMIAYLLHMFTDNQLLEVLGIDHGVFCRFATEIKKKYRPVPYHNFLHAFDVVQTLFVMLNMVGDDFGFTPLERFILLLAGLAHDADHMGLNNGFHHGAETPLGILSNATGSTSTLEIHHCNVTFGVMQTAGCDILSDLDKQDQTDVYKLIIKLILATDMANHVDLSKSFSAMHPYNKTDVNCRQLAMAMLLKLADVSNQCKPFETSKAWAVKIMEEFHTQGDLEKDHQGNVSNPIHDRDNAEISSCQIGFIQAVCEPFLEIVVKLWPAMKPFQTQLLDNKREWLQIRAMQEEEAIFGSQRKETTIVKQI